MLEDFDEAYERIDTVELFEQAFKQTEINDPESSLLRNLWRPSILKNDSSVCLTESDVRMEGIRTSDLN